MIESDIKEITTQAIEQLEKTGGKFKRKRREPHLPIVTQQEAAKKSKHKKKNKKRKVYQVDNSALPEGMPPVEPFMEQWGEEMPSGLREAGKIKANRINNPAGDLKEDIKRLVEISSVPQLGSELLAMAGANAAEFDKALNDLLENNLLFLTRKKRIATAEQIGLAVGKVQITARGFGFLLTGDRKGDVFISQHDMLGALNGDKVLVRLSEGRRDEGNREGSVVKIIERANVKIVGIFYKNAKGAYIQPDSNRMGTQFIVEKSGKAKDGQKVVCSVNYENSPPTVNVIEVLGDADFVGTDVLSIIRANDIPDKFSHYALKVAANIPQELASDDIARREDIRALTTVTIDGRDSKDFDDAVSLERMENGNFMLGVHIADVAHYVREGSALDNEALKRGTSVYFVDRVIPMLPTELSNGICSLNPNEDRLTLSCFMEINSSGAISNHRIAETVMNSNERLVYEDVSLMIEGDEQMRKRYEHIAPLIDDMQFLAHALRMRREKRGSLDFDMPEAKIELDEKGIPSSISISERGAANLLIEDFMLACNETVAEHMCYLERPMLYRVHEVPDLEKMEELNKFLGGFGYLIKGIKKQIHPKALQSVIKQAEGKVEEAVVSKVMLRSLKKARYCQENLGHFGLSAQFYCHFTSPIRRYPDLMVHRIIKEMLTGKLTDKRQKALLEKLPDIAENCSKRERAAMEAERAIDDLKKCQFMEKYIGSRFDGIISGVTSSGIFVELPNTCEGFVRVSDMADDYYIFEDKKYRFIGKSTNNVLTLGDKVRVRVASVDAAGRKVDFELIREGKKRKKR